MSDQSGTLNSQLERAGELARGLRSTVERINELLGDQAERTAAETRTYDVVVIGGGPLGMAFATFLLDERPSTRIAVVERRTAPGFKIGESTLGSTTRAFKSMGLPTTFQRRLFEQKLGLSFWWTGPDSPDLLVEHDVGHFDETIQIERRVVEMALIAALKRRGVDFIHGARANINKSTLGADGNTILCATSDGGEIRLSARVVCDASGPASVIPRALGLYRRKIDSFHSNAYFAYFRKKKDVPLDYWAQPMTRHLMFPQAWVWFIDLQSFEKTPDDKLQAMIDYLFDRREEDDEALPTRRELIEKFDCTVDEVVSIGVVPRDDLDDAKKLPPAERFNHYVEKYPGFKWIMDHFELVEQQYEHHGTFSMFKQMGHDCERVAGDGWVAIGDSAIFVNPLYSPGLTFGSGTAFMAARDVVHALNRQDTRASSFRTYEDYARDLFDQLLLENEISYRSWRHAGLWETAFRLRFAQASTSTPAEPERYSATDPYLLNLLEPRYRLVTSSVLAILREDEESGVDAEETLRKVQAIAEPHIASIAARPEWRERRADRFFSRLDDNLRVVESKPDREVPLPTWICEKCRTLVVESLKRCFVCGDGRPENPLPGHEPSHETIAKIAGSSDSSPASG